MEWSPKAVLQNRGQKYDIKNTNIKSWTLRGCDNSAIYNRTDSNTYELLDCKTNFNYIAPTINGETQNNTDLGEIEVLSGQQHNSNSTWEKSVNYQCCFPFSKTLIIILK